jgi:hypothetical protein
MRDDDMRDVADDGATLNESHRNLVPAPGRADAATGVKVLGHGVKVLGHGGPFQLATNMKRAMDRSGRSSRRWPSTS